ncbi:MAG: hypothetical protein HRU09_03755 [Oligoflexales bacterium]|nr:hypothetical protein [Oligoflexales bacterium]
MSFKVRNSLLLFVLLTVTKTALSLPCPSSNPRYKDAIIQLSDFKNRVDVDQTCNDLFKQLATLSGDAGGGLFFGPPVSPNGAELSLFELTLLTRFSDAVVGRIRSIVNSLILRPQCLKEDKLSVLQSLSSITQEVTSISAAYSGPYGVPVAIGGASIAGILQGIDLIIKKQNYGYRFDKLEYRDLFATNLCSYHDIKTEIVDLLAPEFRVETYDTLVEELESLQEELVRDYPLCNKYQIVSDYQSSAELPIDSIRKKIGDLKSDTDFQFPWNSCVTTADIIHSETSELAKLVARLPGDEEVDMEYVRTLFAFAKSPQGVLLPGQCWLTEKDELIETNMRNQNLISEITNGINKAYDKKLTELENAAESTPTINKDNRNPVIWLKSTIERLDWAKEERKKLYALVGDQSFGARKEISDFKKFFDNRLFKDLAPKFLKWYVKEADKYIGEYEKQLKKYTKELRRSYSDILSSKNRLADMIIEAQNYPENIGLHISLYSYVEKLINSLSGAYLSSQTVSQYKEYFSKAGSHSKELAKLWSGRKLSKVDAKLSDEIDEIEVYATYLDWCHEKGIIQADALKELIEKIRNYRRS